jgi:hypothetical protein
LVADARPFDNDHADVAIAARLNGLNHARIGERSGVAFALQLEFSGIDAARNVHSKYQQQIDLLCGRRRRGDQRKAEENQSQKCSYGAHAKSLVVESGGNPAAPSRVSHKYRVKFPVANARPCGLTGM